MKKLENLNFKKLLHYKNTPQATHDLKDVECTGFCVSCENNNLVNYPNHYLDGISHGCHSSIYESILGDRKIQNTLKVMFILESPGGDRFGEELEYNNIKKRPPVDHYYWSPTSNAKWNKNETDSKKKYEDDFTGIIDYFGFKEFYITNVIKCGKLNKNTEKFETMKYNKLDNHIAKNCYQEFLSKEIELFNPDYILAFGGNSWDLINVASKSKYRNEGKLIKLLHPASRTNINKRINENIKRIKNQIS